MVKASGVLRHCFFGSYTAIIVLRFADKASANDALVTLGNQWKMEHNETHLVWKGDTKELTTLKNKLRAFGLRIQPCGMHRCRTQCQDAEIDNINHSVDYGALFEIDIPTVPAEQTKPLF